MSSGAPRSAGSCRRQPRALIAFIAFIAFVYSASLIEPTVLARMSSAAIEYLPLPLQIDEDARVDLCGQPVRDVGGRHQEGRAEGVRLPFERDVARLEVPVQHQVRQLMHRVEPGSVPMALVGTEQDDRAVPVRDSSYGTASELRPASAAGARQKASARCHSSAVACSSYSFGRLGSVNR